MQPLPNPQGKGDLPLLNELQRWREAPRAMQSGGEVLSSYFTSLLVLSAEFCFKPIVGASYYLYRREGRWQLSPVAPFEWRPARLDSFVAECRLQPDASWTVAPPRDIAQNSAIIDALQEFLSGFAGKLETAATLSEGLPHYERRLPYHHRVLASALSASLQRSLRHLGLNGSSGTQLLENALEPSARASLGFLQRPDNHPKLPDDNKQ